MGPVFQETTRTCTRCSRAQPLSRFKRRSRSQGLRLSWCKDCVNEAARVRNVRKRAKFLGQVAKEIRLSDGASRIECVVAAACHKIGGVEGFAIRVAEAIQSGNMNVRLSAAKFLLTLIDARDKLRSAR